MLDASGAAGAIGAAAGAVEAGVAADLAAALAAGNTQQLRVDLQALYDYYFKVKKIHDEFTQSLATLPDQPESSQQLEVSQIQGVTESVQTTVVSALNMDSGSLKRSAAVTSAALARHLIKIADTYKAYVQVDDQKASELQSAGATGAGDVGYGGGSQAVERAVGEAALVAGAAVSLVPGWVG